MRLALRRKANELANTFLQRAAWFRTPHLLFPYVPAPCKHIHTRARTSGWLPWDDGTCGVG
jgi:hypothetical protein